MNRVYLSLCGLGAVIAEATAGVGCLYAGHLALALVLAMFAAVTLAALPFWTSNQEVTPPE